jgi:hypothetical protein
MSENTYLHAVTYLQHNFAGRIKFELKRLEMNYIWESGKYVSISKGNKWRLSGLLNFQSYSMTVEGLAERRRHIDTRTLTL